MTQSTNIKNELDPLFQVWESTVNSLFNQRTRMLTDRGIMQLLQSSFMKLDSPLSPDELYDRIQATSIDLRVDEIYSLIQLDPTKGWIPEGREIVIPPDCGAELYIQDKIISSINKSLTKNHRWGAFPNRVIEIETVARSSVVRSGPFNPEREAFFIADDIYFILANLSPNSIKFEPGEAIGQAFIKPQIFSDWHGQVLESGECPINTPEGDFLRSLDMGIEIRTEESLRYVAREGYFSLPNKKNSDFAVKNGLIVLHAKSTAKRMRKLDFILEFKNRKEYEESGILYEDIDISNGYTIKENEVIVVDAQESVDLSPHIGMMLYESVLTLGLNPANDKVMKKMLEKSPYLGLKYLHSLSSTNLTWADPGYNGMMAGFPKLPGVTIRPGDPIGLLRVFYYPNGVETPYGDKKRNSQYQGQKTFQVGARE